METLSTVTPTASQKNLIHSAKAIGSVINQYIEEDENNRRLSRPVLEALREAGFLKLLLPKSLGGVEVDPLTMALVIEEVAKHHTAAGWSMMVANTSTWWGGRLPEEGVEEIYRGGPDTLIAGAFHPPMRAEAVNGGYIINGRNPLFSNVHEGQWIFVTALVMENGQMRMNNGQPEVIGVYMKAEDCEIIDTWYTIGMRATDSNDVAANDVFVPRHRVFPLIPGYQPGQHFQGLLYQYPAVGICVACLLAPVALAVARNAIDELKRMAEKKTPLGSAVPLRERGVVQKKLGRAEALVQSSRCYLHHKISEAWEKILTGEKISLEEKAGLLLAAAHTNQSCAKAVDLVYSAAGSSAIYSRNKLAHYFTDAQVIRQHGFMNDSRYESAAQIILGLQPDLPVIAF